MRGDKNNLHIRQKWLDLLGKLHPGDPGHFNIQQEQVVEKMIVRNVPQQVAALCINRDLAADSAFLKGFLCDFLMQFYRVPLVVAYCDPYHIAASFS